MRVGRRTLISTEAAEWRRRMKHAEDRLRDTPIAGGVAPR
jgi:hypothetical protein